MTRSLVPVVLAGLLVAGCAAPGQNVAAHTRAQALRLYVEGATPDEIAAELALEPATARAVIRAELRKLTRRLYASR